MLLSGGTDLSADLSADDSRRYSGACAIYKFVSPGVRAAATE